jgi:nucleotide-binding universal stress UspA family protein
MTPPATADARPAGASAPATVPTVRTILLATDLSPTSAAAETEAIELARDLRADLLVVSVIDPRSLRGGHGQWVRRMDQARSRLEELSMAVVQRARRSGISVRFLIWEGEPAECILEAAVAESAAFIVVGSHGRRGVDRLVAGSVSDRIVRDSPVPVVVARRRSLAAIDSGPASPA